MSVFQYVGLNTNSDVAEFSRNLIISVDQDFNKVVTQVFEKSKAYTKKADDARTEYLRLNKEAQDARVTAANAAADAFKKATGSKVDTVSLRKSANRLLLITNFFEKWDVTGVLKGFVNDVLAFKGINSNVLGEMREAAAKYHADADRLEAEAADALNKANKAYAEATKKVAEQFQTAIQTTAPMLTKAIEYEKLAASLMQTYKKLSAVK